LSVSLCVFSLRRFTRVAGLIFGAGVFSAHPPFNFAKVLVVTLFLAPRFGRGQVNVAAGRQGQGGQLFARSLRQQQGLLGLQRLDWRCASANVPYRRRRRRQRRDGAAFVQIAPPAKETCAMALLPLRFVVGLSVDQNHFDGVS
jgi:hypothetical protein